MPIIERSMELRHIWELHLHEVVSCIECDWKRVMAYAPKDSREIDNDYYEPKYTLSDIKVVEEHARKTGKRPTAVFLYEWSTSGRYRPTVETLRKLVTKLGLYGAMFALARLLGDPEPPRPVTGPGKKIDTNITALLIKEELERDLQDMNTVYPTNETLSERDHNKNIDKPNSKVICEKSKQFHNFDIPESTQSTRQIDPVGIRTFDFIQFSDDGVTSSDLPAILAEGNIEMHLDRDSAKSETQDSQETLQSNTAISEIMPLGISSIISRSEDSKQLDVGDHQNEPSYDNSENTESEFGLPLGVVSFNKKKLIQETQENQKTYCYVELKQMTRGFANDSEVTSRIGGLIGEGGFGAVYVGFDLENRTNESIAIKKLVAGNIDQAILDKQFKAEIYMIRFDHPNLVKVLGYSNDGPEKLIVSEFINGGNLLQKLSEKVLRDVSQRFKIACGTAEGLKYMHKGTSKVMVHNDVKSSNILLTRDCTPKLCDFGLTREYKFDKTELIGTTVYMAPEAARHLITPKMDVYSFGIVLLEILTGLEPIVECADKTLKIHVYIMENLEGKNKNNDVTPLLDEAVGEWPMANDLYRIAMNCLAEYDTRPESTGVCRYLHSLKHNR